jgi:phospholipase D1/2
LKEYKRNQIEYRFNSFAPMRYSNKVEFFVDGADYFEALAYGIESAEEEVFICGWWISP